MIALAKHFWPHLRSTKQGGWKRITGTELCGKALAVLGVGRVGKEVIKRGVAFGMKPVGFDLHWDDEFGRQYQVRRAESIDAALAEADVVSLHLSLSPQTQGLISRQRLAGMKKGAMIINTARGGLVVEADIAEACRSGQLGGYAADVLDHEPPKPGHPFEALDNVIITPHVGSRTFESVERQAMRATLNLLNYLKGDKDYIQANA